MRGNENGRAKSVEFDKKMKKAPVKFVENKNATKLNARGAAAREIKLAGYGLNLASRSG